MCMCVKDAGEQTNHPEYVTVSTYEVDIGHVLTYEYIPVIESCPVVMIVGSLCGTAIGNGAVGWDGMRRGGGGEGKRGVWGLDVVARREMLYRLVGIILVLLYEHICLM